MVGWVSINFEGRLVNFRFEILPVLGVHFRPLPVTFWGRSKNKSDSKSCVLPNLGILARDFEIFRHRKFLYTPATAGACGGAWAGVAALFFAPD